MAQRQIIGLKLPINFSKLPSPNLGLVDSFRVALGRTIACGVAQLVLLGLFDHLAAFTPLQGSPQLQSSLRIERVSSMTLAHAMGLADRLPNRQNGSGVFFPSPFLSLRAFDFGAGNVLSPRMKKHASPADMSPHTDMES